MEELTLERVLGAASRRKGLFAGALALASVVFGSVALSIPPRYRASVVMTIEPGRYPNDFLRPNVIPGLDTRLGGMEKLLESAPVIEELRARTGLADFEARNGKGPLGALGLAGDPLDAWRQAFQFEVLAGQAPSNNSHKADEAVVVEMSFKNQDPEMAARVVNACALRANEENNRFRRAFVEEVVRFVQKAQERARDLSRARQEEFDSFKLANSERLPEQEPYVSARLAQLRVRYADLKNSERFAQARLEQLTAERGLLVAQIALGVQLGGQSLGEPGEQTTPTELRRERLRLFTEKYAREDELSSYRAELTEKCPQVRIAKEKLERTLERIRDIELKLVRLGIGFGEDVPPPREPTARAGVRIFDDEDKDTAPKKPGDLRKVPVTLPSAEKKSGESEPKPAKDEKPETPAAKDARTEKESNEGKDGKDGKESKESSPGKDPKLGGPKPEEGTALLLGQGIQAKVVTVLSGPAVDEKTLEKTLDATSYRLVVANPGYARIRAIDFALKETQDNQTTLAHDREAAFADIHKCEETLAAIPEVRQRLEALGRALVEARDDFLRLENQDENARKALEVENEGKGEQFRVIDFARPPTKTTGPGRPIFVGLALVLAAGMAAAACVVVDRPGSATAAPAPGRQGGGT